MSVLKDGKPLSEKGEPYNYITGANFGGNHFEEKMNRTYTRTADTHYPRQAFYYSSGFA